MKMTVVGTLKKNMRIDVRMTNNQKKEIISTWLDLMMLVHHHDHIADDCEAGCEFHNLQADQYRNQMIGIEKCLNIIGYKISVVNGIPTIEPHHE